MGFEKEILTLLRKIEMRRGHGLNVSRGKRKPNSSPYLKKEIWKLECSVNYKSSPLIDRGIGRSNKDSTLIA